MNSAGNPISGEILYCTLIVKPFRLEPVLNALKPFPVVDFTATEVRGYGRQKGHLELYRGAEYVISFVPKIKIEFSIHRSHFEDASDAVRQAARTGRIGDGKVFIQGCEQIEEF